MAPPPNEPEPNPAPHPGPVPPPPAEPELFERPLNELLEPPRANTPPEPPWRPEAARGKTAVVRGLPAWAWVGVVCGGLLFVGGVVAALPAIGVCGLGLIVISLAAGEATPREIWITLGILILLLVALFLFLFVVCMTGDG